MMTIRRFAAWTVLGLFVLSWLFLLRPSSLGGPLTLITVTGVSMEPNLHTDNLAVMYAQDSYERGDVVAFRATPEGGAPGEGAFVIHRITGGTAASGFVMRGDNNDWDDPWTPTGNEIAGKMLFHVPNLGTGMRWISQPFNAAALLAGFFAASVMMGGGNDNRTNRPRVNESRERVGAS